MGPTVPDILTAASVSHRPYSRCPGAGVYITTANQLIGTYDDLDRLRSLPGIGREWYGGWERHHIVEEQDLTRLGVAERFPPRSQQICVMLPPAAHRKRVNSMLRGANPEGVRVTGVELWTAYEETYSMIGNYCGGGEVRIRRELLAIVAAIFAIAGVKRRTQ